MKKIPDHIERIHKVVRHIEHAIDKDMQLEELAELACFSPFHFQRVFKEILGESPKQYIKRLRLEEAARIIAFQPEFNMLEVALQVGFHSLEVFSRAFKDYYTISPDNYRKLNDIEKINYTQIPYIKHVANEEQKIELLFRLQKTEFENFNIEIVKRPIQRFVYLQTTLQSPTIIRESFKRIKQWSLAHDILTNDTKIFGVIKDYPIFTPIEKCRYWTCVAVNSTTETSGLVNYFEIPASKYASYNIYGDLHQIIKGASYVVHEWLPQSGYKLKLEPIIQIPLHDPATSNFNENEYQVFIPVEPE